jgi:hypothetical protein
MSSGKRVHATSMRTFGDLRQVRKPDPNQVPRKTIDKHEEWFVTSGNSSKVNKCELCNKDREEDVDRAESCIYYRNNDNAQNLEIV